MPDPSQSCRTRPTRSIAENAFVSIPDFPIPGFDFNVITPLLADGERFGLAVCELARQEALLNFAAAVAIESPVLVLGAQVAAQVRRGLVLAHRGGRMTGCPDSARVLASPAAEQRANASRRA